MNEGIAKIRQLPKDPRVWCPAVHPPTVTRAAAEVLRRLRHLQQRRAPRRGPGAPRHSVRLPHGTLAAFARDRLLEVVTHETEREGENAKRTKDSFYALTSNETLLKYPTPAQFFSSPEDGHQHAM
uniref:Putative ionotropic receptor 29 n=1 Tax=Conopomorpha sinensis TaxID=940481 RepID=A0A3Q8HG98_9NEOP|nr:putative ionotropic receptor 29 [Conopomorpha sinensis]